MTTKKITVHSFQPIWPKIYSKYYVHDCALHREFSQETLFTYLMQRVHCTYSGNLRSKDDMSFLVFIQSHQSSLIELGVICLPGLWSESPRIQFLRVVLGRRHSMATWPLYKYIEVLILPAPVSALGQSTAHWPACPGILHYLRGGGGGIES